MNVASLPRRLIVVGVVQQHLLEAASLRVVRSVLVRSPTVRLGQLARADDRLAAHLDGLAVAGEEGRVLSCVEADAGLGEWFVAGVSAIERKDHETLRRMATTSEEASTMPRALGSAFGWVSGALLRGLASEFLQPRAAPQALAVGMAACAAHRIDPGPALAIALGSDQPALRCQALRAASQIGRIDLVERCVDQIDVEPDEAVRFQATWSATLLGARGRAVAALRDIGMNQGARAAAAWQLALASVDPDRARAWVRELAAAPGVDLRTLIQATAWAGDVQAVPWLIKQIESAGDAYARIAGEAVTLLTGADLVKLQLERVAPGILEDDIDHEGDAGMALDVDDGLPWPDPARLRAWWSEHESRMPRGVRCFMGAVPGVGHCARVLRTGSQRQRAGAALLLKLMQPAEPLFNVAAPAARQARLLAAMPA